MPVEKKWYTNRIKRIPFEIIEEFMTEEALAWWYQDDGHLKQDNGIPRKIILSTDSLTKKENEFLAGLLKKKFYLTFSIDRQNRLILYDQFQINYFLKLVEPYIHTSIIRKQLTNPSFKQLAKTSTIYLPTDIRLERPISEINRQLIHLPQLAEQLKERDGHIQFFHQFHKLPEKSVRNAYRIIVKERHKPVLGHMQSVLGWSNSKLVEWYFRIN